MQIDQRYLFPKQVLAHEGVLLKFVNSSREAPHSANGPGSEPASGEIRRDPAAECRGRLLRVLHTKNFRYLASFKYLALGTRERDILPGLTARQGNAIWAYVPGLRYLRTGNPARQGNDVWLRMDC